MDVTNPPPGVTEMADVLPDGLVVVDGQQTLVFCSARAGTAHGTSTTRRSSADPSDEVLPLHDSDGRAWWDYADPWNSLHTVTGHREKLLWTIAAVELLVTARYLRKPLKGPGPPGPDVGARRVGPAARRAGPRGAHLDRSPTSCGRR